MEAIGKHKNPNIQTSYWDKIKQYIPGLKDLSFGRLKAEGVQDRFKLYENDTKLSATPTHEIRLLLKSVYYLN